MIVKRKQIWLLFPFVALLLTLALAIAGCGGTPSPKPQPTFGLKVRPETTEVQVGQSVAIVAEVEPLEKLDLKWSVSGTAEGTLNTDTGEQVVYTAGKGGTDIVIAEGTTASGVPVKQTVSLTVATPVPPTDTPVPPTDTSVPPTDTPVPPTDTPVPPTDTPVPQTATSVPPGVTLTPTPPSSSATVVTAIRVDQPPTIDGRLDLDEEIWSQAQPLTYAVHPLANDSTTVVVRLLWDDQYLYAGFDVSDTQVEGSSATPWDGDSVSIIFDNGGQIQECRHSLLDDGWKTATTERHLKGATTFDNPDDQDEGYSIEMRIPWVRTPAEGSTIAADFLSVDHDYNPGGLFDDRDTVFSKISWDGDRSVDTAMKSILLGPTLTPLPAAECPFVSPIRIPIEGPSVDAEVSITSMENCADNLPTASPIPLAGTYSGDLTNKEIWILVYPENILYYYPQSANACASASTPFANGQWVEEIRLGSADVPEAFHIVAVVTDIGSPASEAFHNYLTVGCNSGNWQGLRSVPPGATELDSITVHTR